MEKICKNCEFWKANEHKPICFGDCLNTEKLVNAGEKNEAPLDGLLYGDGADEQRAFLNIGADFGCIHCKLK